MDTLLILFASAIVLGSLIWGLDRHLCLKELHIDLSEYLHQVMEARDKSESPIRVHFDAQVFALKTLIKKHFVRLD